MKKNNKVKINVTSDNENELVSFIKILLVLVVVFAVVYGLIALLKKSGILMEGYTKPELEEATINYEYILAGSVFEMPDSEYYVVFDDFTGERNEYVYGVLYTYSQKESKLPIYKVDMNNGMNSIYKNNESNKKVQKSSDLGINGVTLIKVKNGKNILYIEGSENIDNELTK